MLSPPSRSLTLIAFRAAGNVSLTTFSQVTCAEAAPVVTLWVPCDLVPWCSTSRRLCVSVLVVYSSLDPLPLEVTFSTKRAGLHVTFPWSSAGPWALRVGLPPWSGPRARLVGEEGQAEVQVCVGAPVPFLEADGLRGLGERGPRPGHVGGTCWGYAGSLG